MTDAVPECPACETDLFVESNKNGSWVCRFDQTVFGDVSGWRDASWATRAGMQRRYNCGRGASQ